MYNIIWLQYLTEPCNKIPDSKVHEANMEPTWVLSAPDGPHVGPMNLAIRDVSSFSEKMPQNITSSLMHLLTCLDGNIYANSYLIIACLVTRFGWWEGITVTSTSDPSVSNESPHKGPVKWKVIRCDDVIMEDKIMLEFVIRNVSKV